MWSIFIFEQRELYHITNFFKYVRNTFLYRRTWPKYKKQSFPSQLIFLLKLSLSIYIFFLLVSSFNAKCKLNANKTDLSSDLGMSINCTHTFRTIDWSMTSGWTPPRGGSPEHGEKLNRSNRRNISFLLVLVTFLCKTFISTQAVVLIYAFKQKSSVKSFSAMFASK